MCWSENFVCVCVCMRLCASTYVVCVCVCLCVCVCVCVCVHVCVFSVAHVSAACLLRSSSTVRGAVTLTTGRGSGDGVPSPLHPDGRCPLAPPRRARSGPLTTSSPGMERIAHWGRPDPPPLLLLPPSLLASPLPSSPPRSSSPSSPLPSPLLLPSLPPLSL